MPVCMCDLGFVSAPHSSPVSHSKLTWLTMQGEMLARALCSLARTGSLLDACTSRVRAECGVAGLNQGRAVAVLAYMYDDDGHISVGQGWSSCCTLSEQLF